MNHKILACFLLKTHFHTLFTLYASREGTIILRQNGSEYVQDIHCIDASIMKSCISFVGLLAVGNCDHISQSPAHKRFRQFITPTTKYTSSSYTNQSDYQESDRLSSRRRTHINHPAIHNIRGGATSTTQAQLSATATMASLFAGSIGGAIGVGVSYPFDTLSTKAQVSTGKGNEKQLNLMKSIARIWKNDGIRGFFEGVLVTVRDAMYVADRDITLDVLSY